MSNNKSTVAVIGLGNIGKTVATNLVKGNREVIIASRDRKDADALAKQLGKKAKATDVPTAIRESDIVVLAVWFNTIQELFKQYETELRGKIIVDPSNPIAADGTGGFKKIIGAEESAGTILSGLLPKGAKLAKAFGSLGAGSLESAAHKTPEHAVLFYATDDNSIDGEIEELIGDSGFDAIRIGGIEQSIKMEVFGELHEFGGLGKTITSAEFKHAV